MGAFQKKTTQQTLPFFDEKQRSAILQQEIWDQEEKVKGEFLVITFCKSLKIEMNRS